jgi:hypothetical protein
VACLKAACAASDHHKRATLVHLGGVWLSLAHAPPAQIDSAMAARIAVMERIQAELRGRLHAALVAAWPVRPRPGVP